MIIVSILVPVGYQPATEFQSDQQFQQAWAQTHQPLLEQHFVRLRAAVLYREKPPAVQGTSRHLCMLAWDTEVDRLADKARDPNGDVHGQAKMLGTLSYPSVKEALDLILDSGWTRVGGFGELELRG